MVTVVARIVSCSLALTVAAAVVACGSIIGIEDGTLDPELNGGEGGSKTDGAAGADGSATADGGGTRDGAADGASSRGPLAPPGGDTSSIPCSAASCPLPAQQCCAYHTRNTSSWTAQCSSVGCPGPAPPNEDFSFAIRCSGPQNCPSGEKCCASQQTAICKASCSPGELQACIPGTTNACGSGSVCSKATFLPTGYAVCFRTN